MLHVRIGFSALVVVAVTAPFADAQAVFRNSGDPIPMGWTGPKFELSKAWPATAPAGDPKPWKSFDFKTQPEQYIRAILTYCMEGNVVPAVDWAGQNNTVRKWYHAPGLAKGGNGREFIHGLTRERTSPKGELHPLQTHAWSNWAVGLYNPTAATVIAKMWANPASPNTAGILFPDGSVGIKLLFTTAPVSEVPFLDGTKEWQANVNQATGSPRSPQMVRLLQVDVAVRDDRADDTTGWLFGTFMYENTATGTTPYEKLVPVGLMWGNDPDLTPAKAAMGQKPVQGWINPASKSPHFGWHGRVNGPVDNPVSSCLSCHARATVQPSPMVFRNTDTEAVKMSFFTNVKAGQPYTAGVTPLDYSLQLAVGVRNYPGAAAAAVPDNDAFNPRGGEEETIPASDYLTAPGPGAAAGAGAVPPANKPANASDKPADAEAEKVMNQNQYLIYAAIGLAVILVIALVVSRSQKAKPS